MHSCLTMHMYICGMYQFMHCISYTIYIIIMYFLHDYYVYIYMLLTMSFLWWISGIFLITLLHCADVQRLNRNVQYWRTRWVPVCFLHIYTHSTITCMRTAKVIPCMGIYLKTALSLSLQCYKMHSQHACNTISPYGNLMLESRVMDWYSTNANQCP